MLMSLRKKYLCLIIAVFSYFLDFLLSSKLRFIKDGTEIFVSHSIFYN